MHKELSYFKKFSLITMLYLYLCPYYWEWEPDLGLFVCLFGFLTSSSTTRLYRGRAPRQSVWQFYVLPHMRQSWETMTSVSAGHIILTPTQPVRSGRPQRESNPGLPHHKSCALPSGQILAIKFNMGQFTHPNIRCT